MVATVRTEMSEIDEDHTADHEVQDEREVQVTTVGAEVEHHQGEMAVTIVLPEQREEEEEEAQATARTAVTGGAGHERGA